MQIAFKLKTGAIVLALATSSAALAQDVNIGVPNWTGARATSAVLKYIAEEHLGLKAGLVPGTNPVIFKAMDRGKGDIDVHPEVWMPNQSNLAAEYQDNKKTVTLSGTPYKALQGTCVTKGAYDAGVKSVADLADPDKAKLFDSDGDGKGEIFVGAPGWASTNIEKVRARGFGYDEFMDLLVIEEEINFARMKKGVQKDQHMAMTCYAPHHQMKTFPIVFIDEPAHDGSRWTMVQPTDDPNWFDKSKIDVAWPSTTVHLAWSKRLDKDVPEFAKLLSRIELSSDILTDWIVAVSVDQKDPEALAKEWVDGNMDTVNKWLGL